MELSLTSRMAGFVMVSSCRLKEFISRSSLGMRSGLFVTWLIVGELSKM